MLASCAPTSVAETGPILPATARSLSTRHAPHTSPDDDFPASILDLLAGASVTKCAGAGPARKLTKRELCVTII